MLFDLPPDAELYEALCQRDARWNGRAFVAVSSTGVFCRIPCPARVPKPENCTFFATVPECLEAGFRPCRKCHPAEAGGAGSDVRKLLAALEADPERRWREQDITDLGLDNSTMRRAFKRLFGLTWLELARQRRLGLGVKELAKGGKVIDAQYMAGFDSPGAFRTAFTGLLGITPGRLVENARLQADWIDTELGAMIAVADQRHLYLLEFIDRKALPTEMKKLAKSVRGSLGLGTPPPIMQLRGGLARYFAGESAKFSLSLAQPGTGFQREVWRALQDIPAGQTRAYSEISRVIGRPDATRAVARANGANQIAILVPCHRVIGLNGALTGYGGGLWRKEKLLELERRYAKKGDPK